MRCSPRPRSPRSPPPSRPSSPRRGSPPRCSRRWRAPHSPTRATASPPSSRCPARSAGRRIQRRPSTSPHASPPSRACSRTSTRSSNSSSRSPSRRSGPARSACASRRWPTRGRSGGCRRWDFKQDGTPVGFFAEFNAWLTALLAGYIGDHVSRIAAALEPAIVTLGIVYVMVWGYLELTGQIEEPFIQGVKRILTLAVILGCALQLWLYHSLLVDTFFNAPSQLGAVIVGAFDPVGIVDQIIFQGGDAANLLLEKGGLFSSNLAY